MRKGVHNLACILLATSCNGFQSTLHTTTTSRSSSLPQLHSTLPKQNPGESDIDYIKRLTSHAQNLANTIDEPVPTECETEKQLKPKGTYKRIEDWDSERTAKKGELSWEEKVQFDGQRFGNQVRQNDILVRNLHTF